MLNRLKLILEALKSNLEAKTIGQMLLHGVVILTVFFVEYSVNKTLTTLLPDGPSGVKQILTWATSLAVLIPSVKFIYSRTLTAMKEVKEQLDRDHHGPVVAVVALLFVLFGPLAFHITQLPSAQTLQAALPQTAETPVLDVAGHERSDSSESSNVCPEGDQFRLRITVPTRKGFDYLSQLGAAHTAVLERRDGKLITMAFSRTLLSPGRYKLAVYEFPTGRPNLAKPVTTFDFDLCP